MAVAVEATSEEDDDRIATCQRESVMTYFKPLRRKIGAVTLGLACTFAAGWVRSDRINDFVATDRINATYRLGSYGGLLNLIRETPPATFGRSFDWSSFPAKGNKKELWAKWISWEGHIVDWQWDWGSFHFGSGTIIATRGSPTTTVESFIFPYWSIVIPLTLLSAWLLLSKPRAGKVKPSSLPSATTEATK